jgi:hypothetical protein
MITHIQVYDPPMCCSTGICGTSIDPDLINFAAMLVQFTQRGVKVERYHLSQQALAFAKNPAVQEKLRTEGTDCLPLIYCDGALRLQGRYPTQEERREWVRELVSHEEEA